MITWLRRLFSQRTENPVITIEVIPGKEARIDVKWPYINEKDEDKEEDKVLMAAYVAKVLYALDRGMFNNAIIERIGYRGTKMNDPYFSLLVLEGIRKLQSSGGKKQKSGPLVKPDDVFDVRNLLLRHGDGGE